MAVDSTVRLERRIRYVPAAIKRTEEKLLRLYREAAELRMHDLIAAETADEAWERQILTAKLEARQRGEPNSMGGNDAP